MANNRIQIKRTPVSGRTPNTTNVANGQYIWDGELALNMADGILYSSNGTSLIELGANNTSQRISTNNLTVGNTLFVVANGNVGIANSTPTQKFVIDNGKILLNIGPPGYETRYSDDQIKIVDGIHSLSLASNPYIQKITYSSGLHLISGGLTRFFVNNSGNASVGTSESTARFTVSSGTLPTTQHIYGTYTDVSNYERINLTANSSGHYVLGEEAGTGSGRDLFLGANNTTHMMIAANGNIGINTTSPAYKLHVGGNPGDIHAKIGYYYTFATDQIMSSGAAKFGTNVLGEEVQLRQGGFTRLIVAANTGNIGIGTTSPVSKLHLLDPTSTALTLQGATWSSGPTIWFGDDSSTNMGRITYVNNGDYLVMGANGETNTLAVTSGGKVGVGIVSPVGRLHVKSFGNLYDTVLVLDNDGANRYTGMQYRNDGVWKAGSYYDNTTAYMVQNTVGGYLFFVNNGVEAVRITATGQVGIGINPSVKLAVSSGTSPTTQHIYGTYTDISNYERINLTANSSGHYILGEEAGTGAARPMYLGANNTAAVTIDSAGNFGIGTSLPTSKLHIKGSPSFSPIRLEYYDNQYHNLYIGPYQGSNGAVYFRGNYDGNDVALLEYVPGANHGVRFYYGTRTASTSDATYPAKLSFHVRGVGNPTLTLDHNGNVGIGNSTPTSRLVVTGNTVLGTNSTSSTSIGGVAIINNDVEIGAKNAVANASNTQTVLTTFSSNKYRGGKFIILGKRSTDSHISEVLVTHNASNVFFTEYSIVYTNTSLFSVSASIVSGNVEIVVTSSLSDINYDIFENKFINELGVYDRSQTLVLDRSGSTIETRAA